jgi:hypothetical protein
MPPNMNSRDGVLMLSLQGAEELCVLCSFNNSKQLFRFRNMLRSIVPSILDMVPNNVGAGVGRPPFLRDRSSLNSYLSIIIIVLVAEIYGHDRRIR